jgi:transcriptional regulator
MTDRFDCLPPQTFIKTISMYSLPNFQEQDANVVIDFMKKHPFAMIIGSANDIPAATQVPLLFDERDGKMILVGHIMRKQDHHLAFEKNPNVLVVFTGPHAYISASWYENPHQASTWNYMSVHARGTMRFTDEQGLVDALRRLTLHYENYNPHSATVFDNLPVDYRTKLMKSIVAFEIEVTSIENVFKLSQNRDEKSYGHIVDRLESQDSDAKGIAAEMTQRSSQLFNQLPE